jgi:hypothetical protein
MGLDLRFEDLSNLERGRPGQISTCFGRLDAAEAFLDEGFCLVLGEVMAGAEPEDRSDVIASCRLPNGLGSGQPEPDTFGMDPGLSAAPGYDNTTGVGSPDSHYFALRQCRRKGTCSVLVGSWQQEAAVDDRFRARPRGEGQAVAVDPALDRLPGGKGDTTHACR